MKIWSYLFIIYINLLICLILKCKSWVR